MATEEEQLRALEEEAAKKEQCLDVKAVMRHEMTEEVADCCDAADKYGEPISLFGWCGACLRNEVRENRVREMTYESMYQLFAVVLSTTGPVMVTKKQYEAFTPAEHEFHYFHSPVDGALTVSVRPVESDPS